jgi:hypothetical protein
VQSPEWQQLLARIGDTLMLHLLLHTSIFLPLPNNSFLQVVGKPMHEVWAAAAHDIRRHAMPVTAVRCLLPWRASSVLVA